MTTFDERNWLEHRNITIFTHRREDCMGPPCPIHYRSDHRMRSFPQHYRHDRHLMERICPHGVGHPDPDDIEAAYNSIHGCDGCCRADRGLSAP